MRCKIMKRIMMRPDAESDRRPVARFAGKRIFFSCKTWRCWPAHQPWRRPDGSLMHVEKPFIYLTAPKENATLQEAQGQDWCKKWMEFQSELWGSSFVWLQKAQGQAWWWQPRLQLLMSTVLR